VRRTVCAYGGGHAARNVYLQAVSLGLRTVVIGAFDDEEVERLLQMKDDERAVCIMPVGGGLWGERGAAWVNRGRSCNFLYFMK